MTDPIYLDYNATTPLDPAVVEAMEPYLRDHFGNPSSDHVYGYRTRAALQAAPSDVLLAMGRDEELAATALRLSLGWATTEREVGTAAVVIAGAVHDLTHRT